MAYQIFLHPGFSGSDYEHWQSHWEREHPDYLRIEQRDWQHPDADEWAKTIERYLARSAGNAVVVAHSLGCWALAYWAQQTSLRIRAALLVAPPDIESPKLKPFIRGFNRIQNTALPFKSMVLASSNDEYMSLYKASDVATAWGSTFVNLGELGHINAKSNLGNWPEGKTYLELLTAEQQTASLR